MPRKGALTDQFEPYFLAALLAGHFQYRDEGFRQKDIRFFLELFSNWMEALVGDFSVTLQNVQVARYLEGRVKVGWVQKGKGAAAGRYVLTRSGLIRVVTALTGRPHYLPLDQVFFVYYFLKSYGALFDEMIREDRENFSPSLRAELTALSEPERVLKTQVQFVSDLIRRMEARGEEAVNAGKLGKGILEKGGAVEEAIAAIQKRFPYELNNRRPLGELMKQLPPGFRPWEMTEGLHFRATYLWSPLVSYLKLYRETLEKLL